MPFTQKHLEGPFKNEINLPASKSISNRLLLIKAISNKKFKIENLSDADDTRILKKALQLTDKIIYSGEGGTTFRFLLALLASKEGTWKLSGSKRLMLRPIEPLIDSLRKIGGDIKREKTHLLIKGKKLEGGKISVNAGVSSQFISALLLVAPTFKNELQISLTGKSVSRPYIDMTIEVMREYGIDVFVNGKNITVCPGKYQSRNSFIESDWSAASYFYELAAFNPGSKILLKGLKKDSLQGDRVIVELFEAFGIKSIFNKKGVSIVSELITMKGDTRKVYNQFIFDVNDCPDLFPALVVTCAAKRISATFKNTSHLNYKESKRANVFAKLLRQLNCKVKQTKNTFSIDAKNFELKTLNYKLSTHNDHRIAMSFAPLASLFSSITFDDKSVVNKSFPDFWLELKKLNN